jgi:hypothetical protein
MLLESERLAKIIVAIMYQTNMEEVDDAKKICPEHKPPVYQL